MGELGNGLHLARLHQFLILLLQLCHGGSTCSTGTLVAGYVNALDVGELLNRLQHHNHHDGRAVGVGDDATWTHKGILSINFRHDEWHVGIHSESAGIIYHHSTILGDGLCKLLACATTCRSEGDIHILKVIVMLKELHLILLSLEGVLAAGTTLRAKQHQVVHREISLCKYAQELLSYSTACTNNSYFHNSSI